MASFYFHWCFSQKIQFNGAKNKGYSKKGECVIIGLAQRQLYRGGSVMRDNEEKLYTVADIEALPEGELAELIDGKMYMMGTPTTTHQRIIGFLHLKFGNYIN